MSILNSAVRQNEKSVLNTGKAGCVRKIADLQLFMCSDLDVSCAFTGLR
jgi:hypothetical protein